MKSRRRRGGAWQTLYIRCRSAPVDYMRSRARCSVCKMSATVHTHTTTYLPASRQCYLAAQVSFTLPKRVCCTCVPCVVAVRALVPQGLSVLSLLTLDFFGQVALFCRCEEEITTAASYSGACDAYLGSFLTYAPPAGFCPLLLSSIRNQHHTPAADDELPPLPRKLQRRCRRTARRWHVSEGTTGDGL